MFSPEQLLWTGVAAVFSLLILRSQTCKKLCRGVSSLISKLCRTSINLVTLRLLQPVPDHPSRLERSFRFLQQRLPATLSEPLERFIAGPLSTYLDWFNSVFLSLTQTAAPALTAEAAFHAMFGPDAGHLADASSIYWHRHYFETPHPAARPLAYSAEEECLRVGGEDGLLDRFATVDLPATSLVLTEEAGRVWRGAEGAQRLSVEALERGETPSYVTFALTRMILAAQLVDPSSLFINPPFFFLPLEVTGFWDSYRAAGVRSPTPAAVFDVVLRLRSVYNLPFEVFVAVEGQTTCGTSVREVRERSGDEALLVAVFYATKDAVKELNGVSDKMLKG